MRPRSRQNSPVLPERSHYFDAGVTQKVIPGLTFGLDGFYKIVRDLIDEGQFSEAPIYFPFNYSQGKIYGVELTANYKSGNFAAYGNLARTVSLAKDVVSGQFNFGQDELNYIANHWIHTDHDQLYTASGGVSYIWMGTKYTIDATFGTGLRWGFANDGSRGEQHLGQSGGDTAVYAGEPRSLRGPCGNHQRFRQDQPYQERDRDRHFRAPVRASDRIFGGISKLF